MLPVCLSVSSVRAQTVGVDTTPSRALPFDPDKALGTSIDILAAKTFDKIYSEAILKESLSAGWGPISYRQNTELTFEAWHWNPNGTWSDAAHQSGYFVGSAEPGSEPFCANRSDTRCPPRNHAQRLRSQDEYSRMTDGDPATYWKSNPYLTKKFTGEPDSAHPQWVVIDFAQPQQIDALRIAWANPFATSYEVAVLDRQSRRHGQTS